MVSAYFGYLAVAKEHETKTQVSRKDSKDLKARIEK